MVRLWLTLAVSQVQGRVMRFPRCTPCCFNEFTKALGAANALVYGERKKITKKKTKQAKKTNRSMDAKFALSNHYSPGKQMVLVAWGTCAIFLCFFFWRTQSKSCHFGVDLPSLPVYLETHIFCELH